MVYTEGIFIKAGLNDRLALFSRFLLPLVFQ